MTGPAQVQVEQADASLQEQDQEPRCRGRPSGEGFGMWTQEEHERFLGAMRQFPMGPWKHIARLVGTRNTRQTMTHAQKYRQKQPRHVRGLRKPGRTGRRQQQNATTATTKPTTTMTPDSTAAPPQDSFLKLMVDVDPTPIPVATPVDGSSVPLADSSATTTAIMTQPLGMNDGELQWVGDCLDTLLDADKVEPYPAMPVAMLPNGMGMGMGMPMPMVRSTSFEWMEHCTRFTV